MITEDTIKKILSPENWDRKKREDSDSMVFTLEDLRRYFRIIRNNHERYSLYYYEKEETRREWLCDCGDVGTCCVVAWITTIDRLEEWNKQDEDRFLDLAYWEAVEGVPHMFLYRVKLNDMVELVYEMFTYWWDQEKDNFYVTINCVRYENEVAITRRCITNDISSLKTALESMKMHIEVMKNRRN